MEHREVRTLDELAALEDGYQMAVEDFCHQLDHSKLKILSMMLETEPYTSQRRMLMACIKLIEIYNKHYKKLSQCNHKLSTI